MKQLLTQKKGLTMVELLLSLAILAVVVLPFSGMFLNSTRIESLSSDYMSATQLAQQLLEEHKKNSYGIDEVYINDENAEEPVALVEEEKGRLKYYVYYYKFDSINKYSVDASGMPDYFDLIARLEESHGSNTGENKVFYYYDNGKKTFGTDYYDEIDAASSSEPNIKQLHLEKYDDDTVRVTISRSRKAAEPLEVKLDKKAEEVPYSLRLECFGESDGSEVTYQIINESGSPLNVYRVDNLSIDDNGEITIKKNRVGISVVSGRVAVKNNKLSGDLVSGVHYKILVRVTDDKGKKLVDLYGISR
ncbi:MAG TPA: prepilin-type N-terminal cleavage/methylation domain-containing protein [Candidatus Nitrosocosmicus sp.]|nr:prepilin-type N-terminal cleavage/methylation domain-containing protein [Candidatus Nitrosocosmicus sp.]